MSKLFIFMFQIIKAPLHIIENLVSVNFFHMMLSCRTVPTNVQVYPSRYVYNVPHRRSPAKAFHVGLLLNSKLSVL